MKSKNRLYFILNCIANLIALNLVAFLSLLLIAIFFSYYTYSDSLGFSGSAFLLELLLHKYTYFSTRFDFLYFLLLTIFLLNAGFIIDMFLTKNSQDDE